MFHTCTVCTAVPIAFSRKKLNIGLTFEHLLNKKHEAGIHNNNAYSVLVELCKPISHPDIYSGTGRRRQFINVVDVGVNSPTLCSQSLSRYAKFECLLCLDQFTEIAASVWASKDPVPQYNTNTAIGATCCLCDVPVWTTILWSGGSWYSCWHCLITFVNVANANDTASQSISLTQVRKKPLRFLRIAQNCSLLRALLITSTINDASMQQYPVALRKYGSFVETDTWEQSLEKGMTLVRVTSRRCSRRCLRARRG